MKWPEFKDFDLPERTILLGYVGSLSHGTHIAPELGGIDDKDVMGICIPPERYFFGLSKFEQIATWVEEYDIVIYDIRKFFRLLLKSNPNILGLLWLDSYIQKTNIGVRLVEERGIFSSQKAYGSFIGYAYSQLRRMENCKHEGYMGAKRKKLVERHGYDTKNAAHLIRLLRMGKEFLQTGGVNVYRKDASQLIRIKQGMYKLEEIKEMARDLFAETEAAKGKSPLPLEPNYEKAEKLLIEIVRGYGGSFNEFKISWKNKS